jgi:hypothetical protein
VLLGWDDNLNENESIVNSLLEWNNLDVIKWYLTDERELGVDLTKDDVVQFLAYAIELNYPEAVAYFMEIVTPNEISCGKNSSVLDFALRNNARFCYEVLIVNGAKLPALYDFWYVHEAEQPFRNRLEVMCK